MSDYPLKIEKTSNSVDLSIVWSIHNFCNFSCSYCPDYNSNGSEKWLNLEHAIKIVDEIHDHYIKRLKFEKILFSFTGGEPLYFKGFADLISYIASKGMYSGLTSNGSGNIKLWKKIIPNLEFISISYHPEFVKDEVLIDLLEEMHNTPDVVIPNVRLMTPSNEAQFEKCINFVNLLKSKFKNYSYEFVKIQNDFGVGIEKSYYSSQQEDFLKDNGYTETRNDPSLTRYSEIYLEHEVFYENRKEILRPNDLVNNNLINFEGWSCNAGLESLYFDYNGDVFKAGCKIGGASTNLQNLDSLEFPSSNIICSFKQCICQADIMISKRNLNLEGIQERQSL